ncbi:hypothetical protein PG995_011410 [Apiospora arundinis]
MASRVPNTTQVIPGASVSIVLKADQRTGREVRGVVRDVLTKGNHHRGIKVRLADGRIGRVQRMAPRPVDDGSAAAQGSTGRQRPQYQDVRYDGHFEPPTEQLDLAAYIKPPKQRGKKGRKGAKNEPDPDETAAPGSESSNANPAADVVTATATCPVCNAFEGDEAAVAHHVATHFE